MNIEEIIDKKEVEIEQMKFLVTAYIKEKKNVDVNIAIRYIHPVISQRDILLLHKAFEYAAYYYGNEETH